MKIYVESGLLQVSDFQYNPEITCEHPEIYGHILTFKSGSKLTGKDNWLQLCLNDDEFRLLQEAVSDGMGKEGTRT